MDHEVDVRERPEPDVRIDRQGEAGALGDDDSKARGIRGPDQGSDPAQEPEVTDLVGVVSFTERGQAGCRHRSPEGLEVAVHERRDALGSSPPDQFVPIDGSRDRSPDPG
jgi:hypothetical protein